MDQKRLEQALAGLALGPLRYFPQVGSTNTEATLWGATGAPDLALVVADEQTSGRGRLDRHWFTPPESALAFSLILKAPGKSASLVNPQRLTALGALAVCSALERRYGLSPHIKWPNDVLLLQRKAAGILVEAHWEGERMRSAILGIGVNVAPASVPSEEVLAFPATCVEDALRSTVRPQIVDRMELLHLILEQILSWRPRLSSPEFLHAWEERLAFRGEWVQVLRDGDAIPSLEGQALGLDVEGGLRLLSADGQVFTLRSGELRLRPRVEE